MLNLLLSLLLACATIFILEYSLNPRADKQDSWGKYFFASLISVFWIGLAFTRPETLNRKLLLYLHVSMMVLITVIYLILGQLYEGILRPLFSA